MSAAVAGWDDVVGWRRAGLRKDGRPLTERGRRQRAAAAHVQASDGAEALARAALHAPSREDGAFIFGMCLGELAQNAPNERAALFLRMALTACFNEAYPERRADA